MLLQRWLMVLSAILALAPAVPARAAPAETAFDALLAEYVSEQPDGINRVDYARWSMTRKDRDHLHEVIADLETRQPSRMTRDEYLAYWINIYNAVTLQVVLGAYPVASIRDIRSDGLLDPKAYFGPWRTKRVTVEGRRYSLDDIEHVAVRPVSKDPRVHYAVNCASLGCPSLRPRAWRAATLAVDLDQAARAFINNPRGVRIVGPGKLHVSSIYTWFESDFASDGGVLAHVRKFADPPLADAIDRGASIVDSSYDWTLNESAPRAPRS
ncbi:MAG: DUF547 domain-containing protein [Hyphomicrobiaceae bacterium]